MKLIGREPTEEMLVAGQEEWVLGRKGAVEDCVEAADIFRAMHDAAPQIEPSPVQPVSATYKSEPVTAGFTACNIEYTKGLEAEIARLREEAQAVNTTLFSVIDEREKAEATIEHCHDVIGYREATIAQQSALLDEQKLSIVALNMCVGGEGSSTTENLTRVGRLEETIKQQADLIGVLEQSLADYGAGKLFGDQLADVWQSNRALIEQLAAAEKGAARYNFIRQNRPGLMLDAFQDGYGSDGHAPFAWQVELDAAIDEAITTNNEGE